MLGGTVNAIRFERYADFLHQAIEMDSLEFQGQFALTLMDEIAFQNLEDTERGIQPGYSNGCVLMAAKRSKQRTTNSNGMTPATSKTESNMEWNNTLVPQ